MRRFWFPLLLGSLTLSPASALPPGQTPTQEMVESYREAKSYRATVDYTSEQRDGRELTTTAARTNIALDRDGKRFRLDAPDFDLLIREGTLYFKPRSASNGSSGEVHYELPAPDPLTYMGLLQTVPPIAAFPLPDVVLATARDPIDILTSGAADTLTTLGDDAAGRPGLAVPVEGGTYTLRLDPDTRLLHEVVIEAAMVPEQRTTVRYAYREVEKDTPLGDEPFEMDLSNSTKVTPPWQGGQGGGGGGGAPVNPSHPLVGQDAPPLELNTVGGEAWSLAEHDQPLVVVTFWASWAPACLPVLQEMQAIADETAAAKAEGAEGVLFVLVNVGEEPAAVVKVLDELKVELTCLSDPDYTTADAYGMQVVPHTVVIERGKIARVIAGVTDSRPTLLREDLAAFAKEQEASASPDDAEADPTDPTDPTDSPTPSEEAQ